MRDLLYGLACTLNEQKMLVNILENRLNYNTPCDKLLRGWSTPQEVWTARGEISYAASRTYVLLVKSTMLRNSFLWWLGDCHG